MRNLRSRPKAALTDPPSQRHQQVPEHLSEIPDRRLQKSPVLTPALRVLVDTCAPYWITSRAPPQPRSISAHVETKYCPQAVPFQSLTLDGLDNDVLAMVVDYLSDRPETDYWESDSRDPESKTIFDFRKEGTSLCCLSLVSKRMREISIPKLFKNVFRYASSMGTLNRRLRDLEGNPLIPSLPRVLTAIKTCDIVTTSEGRTTFCRTRLAKTLPKMTSLVELSITHRKDVDVSGLRATFQRHEVTIPTVTHLRILSHGDWSFLVEAYPNIETLALEHNVDQDNLMHTAGTLRKLKRLEICCDGWRPEHIRRLHQYFPNLQSLALRGGLGKEKISSFADAFGFFQSLTDLAITTRQQFTDADAEDLLSDDDSGDEEDQDEFNWVLSEHDLNEDQSFVAKRFFQRRPILCNLYLVYLGAGDGNGNFWQAIRRSDGTLRKHWPQSQKDRELGKQIYDPEGFPDVFSYPRPVKVSSEKSDPPEHYNTSKLEDIGNERSGYMKSNIRLFV